MIGRFLFGTSNPEKIARVRALLRDLPVAVVSPSELGISLDVEEDGTTPCDNAVKKASSYLKAGGLPALSMDGGLYIDSVPSHLQPGIHVRAQAGPHATDDDIFRYYQNLIRMHGGESTARWVIAAVFAFPGRRLVTREFVDETLFTCVASPIRKPAAPLSSLQIDPDLGKYRSEITDSERAALGSRLDMQLADFLRDIILNYSETV